MMSKMVNGDFWTGLEKTASIQSKLFLGLCIPDNLWVAKPLKEIIEPQEKATFI